MWNGTSLNLTLQKVFGVHQFLWLKFSMVMQSQCSQMRLRQAVVWGSTTHLKSIKQYLINTRKMLIKFRDHFVQTTKQQFPFTIFRLRRAKDFTSSPTGWLGNKSIHPLWFLHLSRRQLQDCYLVCLTNSRSCMKIYSSGIIAFSLKLSITASLYDCAWRISMVSFCRHLCKPTVTVDSRSLKSISKYTE